MLTMECIFISFFYINIKSYIRRSINPTTSKPHYWIKSTADSLHPHSLLYNTGSCSLQFIMHIEPSQLHHLLTNTLKWNKRLFLLFFLAHEFTKLLTYAISISVCNYTHWIKFEYQYFFKISSKLKFDSIFRMINSSLTGQWPTSILLKQCVISDDVWLRPPMTKRSKSATHEGQAIIVHINHPLIPYHQNYNVFSVSIINSYFPALLSSLIDKLCLLIYNYVLPYKARIETILKCLQVHKLTDYHMTSQVSVVSCCAWDMCFFILTCLCVKLKMCVLLQETVTASWRPGCVEKNWVDLCLDPPSCIHCWSSSVLSIIARSFPGNGSC